MPAMFSLGFGPALRDLQADLGPGEHALAYLDDAYILASPARAIELYHRLEHYAFARAHLRLNPSKTRLWNAAGVAPAGVLELAPGGEVWVGNPALPAAQRGIVALGAPIGTPEFVAAHLCALLARHEGFLNALPGLQDTQVAWLLLSHCAAPRAQYVLRTLPPPLTRAFAARHDAMVSSCLDTILSADAAVGLPDLAVARAQLPLRHGGLGLRSAARHAPAAYWASWADAIRPVLHRDRDFATTLVAALQSGESVPASLESLRDARASLAAVGYEPPARPQLLDADPPASAEDEPQLDLTRGWQRLAARAVDDFCHRALLCELDPSSIALLESQAGPFAARVLTARPTSELTEAATPTHRRAVPLSGCS